MRKTYFIFLVAVIIAAGVAVNLQLNSQNKMSSIALTNVEVLASEATGPCPNAARQWDPPAWFYDDHNFVICGSCSIAEGHHIIYGC
jgi:hypothetical protein